MTTAPSWTFDDDRRTLTISFPTEPPVELKLDANSLDDLIKQLGELRLGLRPENMTDWLPGQKTEAIGNPKWTTEPESMRGDTLLHIRDQRFGWLHYLLPRPEAARLALAIKAQTEAPPPPAASA